MDPISTPPAAPQLTVADALGLDALRRGLPRVVAGQAALGRPIRWVHAGEVPDIASLLQGGELLLSTGMGIGARPADQRRFIAQLATQGIAALVIELGSSFEDELPAALVEAAEGHALPLIELHAVVPFVAVTEAIHTEIVNHHYDLLRRADELVTQATGTMLAGEGIPGVLATLAEALGNPVFLEGSGGQLSAYAAPPGTAEEATLSVWGQRTRTAGVGASQPVPSGGRLLALPTARPLDPLTELALERAARLIALALLRDRQENELAALSRGDLLSKLAEGRIGPQLAASRAADLGFSTRREVLLPLAVRQLERDDAAAGSGGVAAERVAAWASALRALETDLDGLGAPVLIGLDRVGGQLLLLVGLGDAGDRLAIATRTAALMRAVARRDLDCAVTVACGPACQWATVGSGLRAATETAAATAGQPEADFHDTRRLALERLLWRLRDRGELADYVESVLGPVLAHDARRTHPLLPTLEALCTHSGGKAQTARALHLNRQALYARLERLEQVLDADLSDAGTLLTLHLALQARRHLAGTGRGDGA